MAQGQFTKQEAQATIEAVDDMFKGLPKTRRMEYIGHLNDIMLFLAAAKSNAPDEKVEQT